MKKKIEAFIGDIIEISLGEENFGYARILKNPLIAFYAIDSKKQLGNEEILKSKVLFRIWVMNSAVQSGRWKIVGHAPLEQEFMKSPSFFKQDALTKEFSIYQDGIERAAMVEECYMLERAAVWSAEHAESRLKDQLVGRKNNWLDGLSLKK
jgi:hypothetical protein